ncbi:hypothetical protein H8S20_18180 [Clostridium sp. NSJ-6]|uniref:Nucleic acid-binding protein n=1 Tax=Clostridium hominis TaxID=2763036 RepID=A0ABR7DI68_9CLOT|nr:hypothetical protein [Clostridium hominis]MBC5630785.1 hypothetical protein [Clostridium hominis]
MRKCLRCDEVMIEDYMLKTENLTAVASVVLGKGGGIFSSNTKGKVKAAVCPRCGEISIFFDELDKIK